MTGYHECDHLGRVTQGVVTADLFYAADKIGETEAEARAANDVVYRLGEAAERAGAEPDEVWRRWDWGREYDDLAAWVQRRTGEAT